MGGKINVKTIFEGKKQKGRRMKQIVTETKLYRSLNAPLRRTTKESGYRRGHVSSIHTEPHIVAFEPTCVPSDPDSFGCNSPEW